MENKRKQIIELLSCNCVVTSAETKTGYVITGGMTHDKIVIQESEYKPFVDLIENLQGIALIQIVSPKKSNIKINDIPLKG